MLAYNYPMLDIFWSILGFFIFVLWIWLVIYIFMDIFRSADLRGAAKCAWVILVLVIPFIGVLAYLLVRGGNMHERAIHR